MAGSGNASRAGMKLSIMMCRAYALVVRNSASVPWSRSSTPSTPKHWLNLDKNKQSIKSSPCTPITPAILLEMVKVVRFRAGKERQMVAGVSVQRGQYHERKPQPGDRHVAAEHEDPQKRWHQIAEHVLDRMAVDGGDRDRGRPLVVLLVDVPVDAPAVQQPVRVVKRSSSAGFLHRAGEWWPEEERCPGGCLIVIVVIVVVVTQSQCYRNCALCQKKKQ